MTVNKAPPTELPADIAAFAIINGISIQWSKLNDQSIEKLNFYQQNPITNPPDGPTPAPFLASATATSTVKTITGLNNGQYYHVFVEAEDAYGQRTQVYPNEIGPNGLEDSFSLLIKGFSGFTPSVPDDIIVANIPQVVASPPPGAAPSGSWVLHLGVPGWSNAEIDPNNKFSTKRIYWKFYPNIPDETSFVYNPSTGMPFGGAADINAVAFFNGKRRR